MNQSMHKHEVGLGLFEEVAVIFSFFQLALPCEQLACLDLVPTQFDFKNLPDFPSGAKINE